LETDLVNLQSPWQIPLGHGLPPFKDLPKQGYRRDAEAIRANFPGIVISLQKNNQSSANQSWQEMVRMENFDTDLTLTTPGRLLCMTHFFKEKSL
jgi:hypothetical protein